MLKYGANNIGKIFLGSNEIGKAFLGSNLVFKKDGGQPQPTVNYLISGAPTINGTIMTPASQRGFIYTNKPFNPGEGVSWIIQTKLKFNSFAAWRDVWSTVNSSGESTRSIVTQVINNRRNYELYMSNNGSSWNIASNKCPGIFPVVGTWIVFQLVCTYSNGQYTFKQGYPEVPSWTNTLTTSAHPTYGYNIAFGGGFGNNGVDADFDLSETKIFIDGSLWWEAITNE